MRWPLLPIAVLTAAALAGCSRGVEPVRARDDAIELRIRDFRYVPQEIEAKRGRIVFRITNRGRLPHNFNVRGPGRVRLQVSTLLPGETTEVGVKLGPGDYRMFCSIGNHEELGLYGRLVVSR